MNSSSFHHQQTQQQGGKQLFELLRKLGYEHPTGTITPESFEWVFSYESTNPMMKHLCTMLNGSNLISNDDLEDYYELEKNNKTLNGEELEQAVKMGASRFHRYKQTDEDDIPLSALEQECEQLTSVLEEMENRLERKRNQRDHITSMVNSLSTNSRQKLYTDREEDLHKIQTSTLSRDQELNQALHKLETTSVELVSNLASDECKLISHVPLTDYMNEDKLILQDLEQHIQKTLQDIGSDDTENSIVWSTYKEDCAELERLRKTYPAGEEQYLTALTMSAKLRASLEMAKKVQTSWHVYTSQYLTMGDSELLDSKIQQLDQRIDSIKRELSGMLATDTSKRRREDSLTIPQLLQELTKLHSVSVLAGDHDLAVARRKQRLEVLDRTLDHIVQQKSTHSLLQECLLQEQKRVQRAYHLMKAVCVELDSLQVEAVKRSGRYHTLAEEIQPEQILQFIDTARSVQEDKETKVSMQTGEAMTHDVLRRYEKLEQCLFGTSNNEAISNHPKLLPTELVESMQILKDTLDQLNNELKRTIQERDDRQHIAK